MRKWVVGNSFGDSEIYVNLKKNKLWKKTYVVLFPLNNLVSMMTLAVMFN